MKFCVAMVLFVLSVSAFSMDWTCRNNDLEISCAGEKCESSSIFTPMDVQVSRKGEVRICAYSDCWNGKGKVFHAGKLLAVMPRNLKSAAGKAGPNYRRAAIVIDVEDKVGLMKLDSYAQPLTCDAID